MTRHMRAIRPNYRSCEEQMSIVADQIAPTTASKWK